MPYHKFKDFKSCKDITLSSCETSEIGIGSTDDTSRDMHENILTRGLSNKKSEKIPTY